MSSKAIEVRIWDHSVGAVALDPATGYYVFAYRPEWVKRGIELAPRTMPVANYRTPYSFSNLNVETYQRLPAMLADALPDDFGNALGCEALCESSKRFQMRSIPSESMQRTLKFQETPLTPCRACS